jgi:3-phenylpropionate/trans-cinnamate dioxygenase ferredoxin component
MSEVRGPAADDAHFVTVAKEAEVPEGSMFVVAVSGSPILISKIGGRIYAVDAVCSHMHGFLPRGKLEGRVVTCPVHGAQYDITSGEVVKNVGALMKRASRREASRLLMYEVQVASGEVRIKPQ